MSIREDLVTVDVRMEFVWHHVADINTMVRCQTKSLILQDDLTPVVKNPLTIF